MDSLLGLKVFWAVVENGSFAGAASKLKMSRAMVSKHVMQLEDRLRARLLNRTTRSLSLTETGAVAVLEKKYGPAPYWDDWLGGNQRAARGT